MGKRGKRSGDYRKKGQSDSKSGWGPDVKQENEAFERYYKTAGIIPEDEWDTFWATLKIVLPTTFRVTGSRATAQDLNTIIKDQYVPSLTNVEFEGQILNPPRQLPWYPDGLGWQLNVSKSALRKTPELKKFHNFLVYETEVGNVSRQEAVSMIPPLLLDLQPHHNVIDMCAAPGSKTAQLLEALHANDTALETSFPQGFLIANDSDNKRAHMLVHQSSRLPSPALMVTNLDASIFPRIQTSPGSGRLMFDRILCDVPCSGDGTTRKNMGVWKNWTVMNGNGLHSLQLRILVRAMHMLKSGGRLVYSTCSMNPVENEAVVAAALNKFTDFELVDVSSSLPELIRRPGLSSWHPPVNKEMSEFFDTYAAFKESLPPAKRGESKLQQTQWPPKNVAELHLERCIRIYPHLQDTGAFFVAVLQRKSRIPVESSSAVKRNADVAIEASDDVEGAASKKQKTAEPLDQDQEVMTAEPVEDELPEKSGKGNKFKELPYTFLSDGSKQLQQCINDLQIKPSFPSSNLFVRNPDGEALRQVYLCNDAVRQVLTHNDFARLRLITAGVRVFSRQEGGPKTDKGESAPDDRGRGHFRFLTEGTPAVLPYVDPARIVLADIEVLRVFMRLYYPICSEFSSPLKEKLVNLEVGSYLMRFELGEESGASIKHPIVLPIWKSATSVSLMLDKKAKSALSLRLWGEDITPVGVANKEPVEAVAGSADADIDEDGSRDVDELDEALAEDHQTDAIPPVEE
ncbi:S-adenosyl-L-methionine-dependent methyltransferase [Ceratobasidium sp. AG-I]|nr:S-adenosyl-L-methionine-dependent methyltransferase [Ceratobasidium sp. AG-I]